MADPAQRGAWPLAGLLLCASAPLLAEGAKLEDVRLWSQPGVTRIAVQLSAEVQTRRDRLSNPDRQFFDFLNTESGRRGIWTISVGDELVRQIRIAEAKPGVMRLVLDLIGDAEIATSELANPYRLMIEVKRPGFEPPVKRAPAVWVSVSKPPNIRSPRQALPVPDVATAWPAFGRKARQSRESKVAVKLPPPPDRAQPARRTTAGSSSMTRALGLKIRRVVLDPGHGGHDQGSSGPSGLLEKELVLDVSRRLGALIERGLGSEVIYTRNGDTYVPLEQRTRIANECKADLFLSIHANSSPLRAVTGVETYFLSFTTSKEALEVAGRENATSERSVFELRDLLQKIALQEKVEESREFAARVNSSLVRVWGHSAASRNRGVKKAPFVVLIGASMPSVLAEVGFLSNPRDEREMKKPEVRQKIAEALYKGIAQYAGSLSHFAAARHGAASN